MSVVVGMFYHYFMKNDKNSLELQAVKVAIWIESTWNVPVWYGPSTTTNFASVGSQVTHYFFSLLQFLFVSILCFLEIQSAIEIQKSGKISIDSI